MRSQADALKAYEQRKRQVSHQPPRPELPTDMHETKELMPAVIEMAKHYGWRVYHTHDSRKSAAGFPDLVLVRKGVLVFAELKSEKGVVSTEQQEWLRDLSIVATHTGAVGACVWRPRHWHDGTIEETLR